jgi:hypothetical protein
MIAQPQGGFAAPAAPVQAAPLFQNQVVIDQLDQLCHRYQEDMVHGNLQVQVVAKSKFLAQLTIYIRNEKNGRSGQMRMRSL